MVRLATVIAVSTFKGGACVLNDSDPLNDNRRDANFGLFINRQTVMRCRLCKVCNSNRKYVYDNRIKCKHVRTRGHIVCRKCRKVVVNEAVLYCLCDASDYYKSLRNVCNGLYRVVFVLP